MKKPKYRIEDGWYLDLNENGDICWYNNDTGEKGDCWETREEAETGHSPYGDDEE